jgi:hypothetical protein
MAIQLSKEDLNILVDNIAFLPNMFEVAGRAALLNAAFTDYPHARRMTARINYSGDVTVFTIQMITQLTNFGQIEKDKEALGVLLEHIADPKQGLVGVEDQIYLRKIIAGYQMLPGIASKEQLAESKTNTVTAGNTGGENGSNANDCYVFISYARPNVEVAKTVAKALAAANYGYFHDIKDIQPGDMWSQRIEAGLRKASHMILLLSKASMPERKEVEREWFYFDMQKKPIYTLLVEDCDINSRLVQINYVDARTDVNAAVQQLVATLDTACKA